MASNNRLLKFLYRHPAASLVGTVFLGAIGSALWERVLGPGVDGLWRIVFTVVTLGSDRVVDNTYHSAALDQTPVMSYHVYVIVNAAFVIMATFMVFRIWFELRRQKTTATVATSEGESEHSELAPETTLKQRFYKCIAVVCFAVCGGWEFTNFVFANQSLLIWRSFHGDLRQCAPYLSDDEEERILANYSGMTSKSDFLDVIEPFERIAEQHAIVLHSTKLW